MSITKPRPRTAAAKATRPTAALIAAHETNEVIATILDTEGLQTAVYERVGDLLDDAGDSPAVVVLWVDDTSPSSLTAVLRPLTQDFEEIPIVVVCAGIQRWGIRTALAIGAAGVVVFSELDTALAPCLQAVFAGMTCVPRAYSRQIEPPALSSREKQILGLVVMGYMNSQIAEQLFLAESTIKSHLSSAFGKLGVRSRNEAVNLIVDPERGLGMGILGLGAEPLQTLSTAQ